MQPKINWLALGMSGTGKRTTRSVAVLAFALALVGYGCRAWDDLTSLGALPGQGSLVVRTVTEGASIDPDGYQLRAESGVGDFTEHIGTNDTLQITVIPNDWTVTLNDVAANCSVDVNPQVADVPLNSSGFVTFNVTCC